MENGTVPSSYTEGNNLRPWSIGRGTNGQASVSKIREVRTHGTNMTEGLPL